MSAPSRQAHLWRSAPRMHVMRSFVVFMRGRYERARSASSEESVLVPRAPARKHGLMGSYGDYCPIAVGNEVVGDRWSPLILREIMVGSHGFNDIHRGIPRISRTLLAQRLRRLERDGLVERHSEPGRQSVSYDLTDAGRDLEPVIFELGRWASRWVFGDPRDDQLDVANFVWRLHQFTNEERAPQPRTTIEFDMRGPGGGRAWLVFDRGASTACLIDPGYEPALVIFGDLRELCRWFAG